MLEQIRNDFSTVYPQEIIDALIDSFVEIRENYYLGKYEPAELNGGKFVEACVRLLQYEFHGTYTPIGQSIRNMFNELRNFEQTPRTHHDSLRLHIPRILGGIYNIRNRRGVGHLGGDVNPNFSDSNIVVSSVNWILAELYRLHYTVSLDEAQRIIDELVERKLTLIYDLGNLKRVINPKLTAKKQVLIFLYSAYPNSISDAELIDYIEYSNVSYFKRNILSDLHKKRQIEYSKDGDCLLLPPGLQYVENNYNDWLKDINNGG